jgi:hypothetical protein
MNRHVGFFAAVIGLIAAVAFSGACKAQAIDDPFSDYLQRSVTITMGAGNAKDTNAAIHTINPWPPYVGNTHIHTTGRQAADSIERLYRVPNPFEREIGGAGAAGSGTAGPAGTGTGNGGLTGAPATPVQPISGGY